VPLHIFAHIQHIHSSHTKVFVWNFISAVYGIYPPPPYRVSHPVYSFKLYESFCSVFFLNFWSCLAGSSPSFSTSSIFSRTVQSYLYKMFRIYIYIYHVQRLCICVYIFHTHHWHTTFKTLFLKFMMFTSKLTSGSL